MKAGRPVREKTQYKIIIHVNGGRRYASAKINYTIEEGKKVSRHKHWESIDDNNRFHPNTTYFNASPAERRKLIFPEDLDLSEAKGRSGKRRVRVEYDKEDVDRQYGATCVKFGQTNDFMLRLTWAAVAVIVLQSDKALA